MASEASRTRVERSRIFLWLTIACAVVAIGGFMPTYWLQLPARTFKGPPLLHIHGVIATLWILFLVSQAWLVSNGRIRNHRDWGLFGISLATLVVVVGVTVAITALKFELAQGFGDPSRSFLIVPLSAMAAFAGFTAAAIANVHRPDWHKRLMIIGTVNLIGAAAARIGFVLATGGGPGARPGLFPPPPAMPVIVTGLLLQLIVIAGMIHDKRTTGRVHPAWIIGLLINIAVVLLRHPLGATQGWIGFADWFTRIAG